MEQLLIIQSKLKAPKSQFNKFGNFPYRNCEDILEAVKPLLKETKTTLTLSDDIVYLGGRYYVKATATLCSEDGKLFEKVWAFARESEEKKGMDSAQITGAASSYARKYALNGLFAIDDTKDADTPTQPEEKPEPKQEPQKHPEAVIDKDGDISTPKPMLAQQKNAISNLLGKEGMDEIQIADFFKTRNLTFEMAGDVIKRANVYAKEYLGGG